MTRPVIVVSDESQDRARQIREALHSQGITVIGDDGVIHPPGDYAEAILQQLADDNWVVPRMVGGSPEPVPRPDIEDWNKRVEAKKLAKRYAKGK